MSDRMPDPGWWRGPEPWFGPVALVVRALVWLLVDVRVAHAERLPRTGPVLLPANHVSKLDPPVLGVVALRARTRVRFLAVEGLFATRILGWALRVTRMIPVRRGGGPERMVADARAALAADQAIIIYPEGTIPRETQVLLGRPGAGLLALEAAAANVPIVPMASWGLDHRGGRRLPRLLRRRAGVAFGRPLDLSSWEGRRDRAAQLETSAAMLEAVRSLVSEAEAAARCTRPRPRRRPRPGGRGPRGSSVQRGGS